MEMCYDGALVMPSSYAVMDAEEMTYVEGGDSIKYYKKGNNAGYKELLGAAATLAYFAGISSILQKASTAMSAVGLTFCSALSGIFKVLKWVAGTFATMCWDAAMDAKSLYQYSDYRVGITTFLGVPVKIYAA